MASIRKRGSNSYLIVVSRGYDYEGNRLRNERLGKGQYTDAADDMLLKLF